MRGEVVLGNSLLDRINAELDGVTEAKPIVDCGDEVTQPHDTVLPAREALQARFGDIAGQLAVACLNRFCHCNWHQDCRAGRYTTGGCSRRAARDHEVPDASTERNGICGWCE